MLWTTLAVLAAGAASIRVQDQPPAPGAAAVAPLPTYAEAAREVTASIQKDFYDEKTGLYAQSLTKRDPEFMWGNGVMFSVLASASRQDPAAYRPVMERFFSAMDGYWDAKAAVPGYEPAPTKGNGHDKYYDDNQWMVITFMEAYEVTREAKYLDRAQGALKFSLSGWDDVLGGGIWWHEKHKGGSKNTCANGPAAVACLRVARWRDGAANVEWARKLVRWTSETLQDRDGLFFDHKKVEEGRVNKGKLTYNAALMLRANLGLHRATGEAAYLAEASRIGSACSWFVDAKTGGYRDAPKFSHLLLEADLELYRATGDAAILARARRHGEASWARWRSTPPKELIDRAAIARVFWLLAEQESEPGRVFWAKSDEAKPAGAHGEGGAGGAPGRR